VTLTRESWLPQALLLDEGRSARVAHDCGDGRTLHITRDAGLRAWCYRCSEGDSAPPPRESTADTLARMARQRAADEAAAHPALPEPRVYTVADWPPGAALWFYRAGLGKAEIGKLGAYYHPPTDRAVLPVLRAGVAVFWQARAWQPGRQPKYLGPAAGKAHVIARYGAAPTVTLTEDLLSAFKVGQAGGEGWAVLGTVVNAAAVVELLRRGQPVRTWLDPDAAGRRGAAKIAKQLRAYGLTVRDVVSDLDPKLHTLEQIKEQIE